MTPGTKVIYKISSRPATETRTAEQRHIPGTIVSIHGKKARIEVRKGFATAVISVDLSKLEAVNEGN